MLHPETTKDSGLGRSSQGGHMFPPVGRSSTWTQGIATCFHVVIFHGGWKGAMDLGPREQNEIAVVSCLKIALRFDQTSWLSSAAEVKDVATNPCAHQTIGVKSSVCIQCINGSVDKHCPFQPHNYHDC